MLGVQSLSSANPLSKRIDRLVDRAKIEEDELNAIGRSRGYGGTFRVVIRDVVRGYLERQYVPSEEERRVPGESMRILKEVLNEYRARHPDWADL